SRVATACSNGTARMSSAKRTSARCMWTAALGCAPCPAGTRTPEAAVSNGPCRSMTEIIGAGQPLARGNFSRHARDAALSGGTAQRDQRWSGRAGAAPRTKFPDHAASTSFRFRHYSLRVVGVGDVLFFVAVRVVVVAQEVADGLLALLLLQVGVP